MDCTGIIGCFDYILLAETPQAVKGGGTRQTFYFTTINQRMSSRLPESYEQITLTGNRFYQLCVNLDTGELIQTNSE